MEVTKIPNSDTHMLIGGGIGALCYLGYKWINHKKPSALGVIASFGLGGIGGLLPDILEPATNPNHRKLFHSVGTGALLGTGLVTNLRKEKKTENDLALIILLLSYLSHLAGDATTTKSLPLL